MKKVITLLLLLLVLVSCKKETGTVQTYFLEAERKPEFVSFDVSSELLSLGKGFINSQHHETFNTVKKVKLVGLSIDKAKEGQYEEEKTRLQNILATSKYKRLMNIKKNNQQIVIYHNGNAAAIDEIIAFGYSDELGVGLARILGDNMNPKAILDMVDDQKIDPESINVFSLLNGAFSFE